MKRRLFVLALIIIATTSAAEVGIPDTLVVGIPYEDVDSVVDAGAVQAIFGPIEGSGALIDQLLYQYGALPGTGEIEDLFGSALAGGDFNGDGRMDLAIGVPEEDVDTIEDAGAVHVLYAESDGGFDLAGSQLWFEEPPIGGAETGDEFGAALATGDFNRDDFDDLAIGIPGESSLTNDHVGMVTVLYGSPDGLSGAGVQWWHQETAGVPDDEEANDRFGAALATGDFDGDGWIDLAIGSPHEDVAQFDDGAVTILHGSSSGLSAVEAGFLTDPFPSVEDSAQFGFALAAGNLDNDGDDELAVGAPKTNVIGFSDAGQVTVYFGDQAGLSNLLVVSLFQGSEIYGEPIEGWPGETNLFGNALACGNFNGDAFEDLVIAAPWDDEAGPALSGAVHVLHGSPTGPTGIDDQIWHGDSLGLPVTADAMSWFGHAVGAGDLDGDGIDDLAVGIPLQDGPSAPHAGGVVTMLGGAGGLTAVDSRLLQQGFDGLSGLDELDDYFGAPIAVLRGVEAPLFADDFESGDASNWANQVP